MSSIVRKSNIKDLPSENPELKRQDAIELKSINVDVEEKKEDEFADLTDGVKNPVAFITNFPFAKVKLNDLKGLEPVYEYGDGFINRNPSDLLKLDYYNIWINCDNKDALKWFNKNVKLLQESNFKIVGVWYGRGVEKSKWLEGLAGLTKLIFNLKDLKKAKKGAINAEQFLDELQSLALKIDSPPFTACCGLVSLFRKKKVEETN